MGRSEGAFSATETPDLPTRFLAIGERLGSPNNNITAATLCTALLLHLGILALVLPRANKSWILWSQWAGKPRARRGVRSPN
ncbi:hypothetical protein DL93DRAFT_2076499, partial [Clavulina sp. PMI_390]